jgi:glutamine---fructose-6-phosphate transaminase (isomerizing)
LALVNDTTSPLAGVAEVILDLAAGPERSVAATKSVLASMAAGLALVEAWTGRRGDSDGLSERLTAAAALDWSELATVLAQVDHIFTVGRGPAFGVAHEAALKVTEVCGHAGLAYSTAEFAHGPMALAAATFPVLAFLQDDAARAGSEALLNTLTARGIPVLCAGGSVAGARSLPVLPAANPAADVMTMLVPFYLAAEAAARQRGREPDKPASLSKVTLTR